MMLTNFVSISNILFNFFVNSAASHSLLFKIILSTCNFHILSLNNCTNLSANILFVIVTKYTILDNLLQTTKIVFFSTTNSNFVIKSTIHSLFSTLFVFAIIFSVGVVATTHHSRTNDLTTSKALQWAIK